MLDPALLTRQPRPLCAPRSENRGIDLRQRARGARGARADRRRLLPEIEGLKREQNAAGDEVARAKRQGLDTSADSGGEPRSGRSRSSS